MNGTVPRYLGSELQRVADIESHRRLRSASSPSLHVPRSLHRTIGDRAFPVAAAKIWNALPPAITSLLSLGHSSVHWKRNCSADHVAMQTIGHSSIDITAVVHYVTHSGPEVLFQDLRRDEIRGWWWWWWWWWSALAFTSLLASKRKTACFYYQTFHKTEWKFLQDSKIPSQSRIYGLPATIVIKTVSAMTESLTSQDVLHRRRTEVWPVSHECARVSVKFSIKRSRFWYSLWWKYDCKNFE